MNPTEERKKKTPLLTAIRRGQRLIARTRRTELQMQRMLGWTPMPQPESALERAVASRVKELEAELDEWRRAHPAGQEDV